VRPGRRVPLVVLLHGCTQTAASFAAVTEFNQLADRRGFVVVYPRQLERYNAQRCWQWFHPAHQHEGHGEPAMIAGIVDEVIARDSEWLIDTSRVYIAGLSAGGAMALILAACYPDRFVAVGTHSALPYRAANSTSAALAAMAGSSARTAAVPHPLPPMIVFHGSADTTVHVSNGRAIVEQWLASHAEEDIRGRRLRGLWWSRIRRGRRVVRWRWRDSRRRHALEYWLVDGLGHAWCGGAPGLPYSDPAGPSATKAMWRFFRSSKRPTRSSRWWPWRRGHRTLNVP
jgi:poly(hydroxyalkanoate) depolymerase family esterase